MNVTSAARVDVILGELRDTQNLVDQASEDKREQLFEVKMKDLFAAMPTSGAEFSGRELSDGVFGNLEAIAFTGVVLGSGGSLVYAADYFSCATRADGPRRQR
jgi:hypothetical protein